LYAQQKVGTLTLTVTQDALPSAFVPGEASTSANSGTVNLSLQAADSVSWTAAIPSGTTWARIVSGGTGNGAGTIGVQVDANPSVYPRTFTVTAAAATATVTQQGRAVTVSPLSVVLGTNGAGVSVNINAEAGATWNASSDVTWANLTTTSGTGPGTTMVVAGTYSSTSPSRTGTMKIAGKTVYVTQRGYTLSISPSAATLPGNNGQGSVAVSASGTAVWEALATVPWITITSVERDGTRTLTYSLADNTTGATRTGQIIVAGEVFTINQTAGTPPTITAQPVGVTVTAGQNATFAVTATGTSALTYQWKKGSVALINGGNVSGATSSILTLTNVSASDAGDYRVDVTDGSLLTTTSSAATLTVSAASAQTISFSAIPDKAYGDVPFNLSATASSGLPVSFAVVSGPATVSGSTVTLSAAGTVVIRASQAGNTSYAPATPVERSFVVAKAVPVVVWNPPTSLPAGTALGSSVLNASALPAGGTFTYSPAAGTTLSTVGSQTLSVTYAPATADSANHASATVQRTVTVTQGGSAPVFTVQPLLPASPVEVGGTLTLTATVTGDPAPSFQWKRNGVALANGGRISGAASATLTITTLEIGDSGSYSVVASNAAGSATSNSLAISVVPAGLVAAHTVSGPGYFAGGTVTITSTLTYPGTATSLGWQILLPPGWSYVVGGGTEGDVKPSAGQTDTLEWAWSVPPVSPVTFTFTLQTPATDSGEKTIAGFAIARLAGSSVAYQLLAKPDPLPIPQVRNHSADVDANFRLSLLELTRVIELYNTRNGTSRTGCYVLQAGTEDGFAPDPTRLTSVVVNFSRYHSADVDRNGRFSLMELTRVIELYNYRSGTTRTGQYKLQSGTEDGFAPGP
jgi:Immunoglobulin I-set domain/Immunoglobulin domain/Putative binding domain, N-terminal